MLHVSMNKSLAPDYLVGEQVFHTKNQSEDIKIDASFLLHLLRVGCLAGVSFRNAACMIITDMRR
jgi:hypothetical protein